MWRPDLDRCLISARSIDARSITQPGLVSEERLLAWGTALYEVLYCGCEQKF